MFHHVFEVNDAQCLAVARDHERRAANGGDTSYFPIEFRRNSAALFYNPGFDRIARAFTNRSAIVAFDGAFHGRSFLALAMTASNAAYRQNFGPFPAGVYHAPYPDVYRGWTASRAFDAFRTSPKNDRR